MADYAVAQGYEDPYTNLLVGFSLMFLVLGPPLYYFAGKYYQSDKKRLNEIFN
jgi:hypothetical protein